MKKIMYKLFVHQLILKLNNLGVSHKRQISFWNKVLWKILKIAELCLPIKSLIFPDKSWNFINYLLILKNNLWVYLGEFQNYIKSYLSKLRSQVFQKINNSIVLHNSWIFRNCCKTFFQKLIFPSPPLIKMC